LLDDESLDELDGFLFKGELDGFLAEDELDGFLLEDEPLDDELLDGEPPDTEVSLACTVLAIAIGRTSASPSRPDLLMSSPR
jgi:hypothetical protein